MSATDARLQNKVAIITGAARGLGAATVRAFVARGAKVVVADVLDGDGETLAKELKDSAAFVHLDVTDEAGWSSAVEFAIQEFGKLDVLVNNAGIMLFKSLQDTTKAEFLRQLNVNLMGYFLGINAVSPHMTSRKSGAIVNIASTGGMSGRNGIGAYATSKWAVRGLSRVAALELGFKGVRVNTVMPGAMQTAMTDMSRNSPEELKAIFKYLPLQRIGRTAEIANLVAFLASDEASYIAGAEYAVDGGETAGTYRPLAPGAPS